MPNMLLGVGGTGVTAAAIAAMAPSLFLYADPATIRDTSDGSIAAAEDIGTWVDQSGNANDALGAGGTAGVYQTDGVQFGASKRLALTSPIVLGTTFAIYTIGTRADAQIYTPIAGSTASNTIKYIGIYSDNKAYIEDDAGIVKQLAVSLAGTFLALFKGTAGAATFTATGIAETAMVGATPLGATTLAMVGARHSADYSNSACRFRSLLVFNRAVTAGEHATILSWSNARYGVAL